MLINGSIEYNNNGVRAEKEVYIDTSQFTSELDHDICDAVAFALFGKTIFREIVQSDKGVPLIILNIKNKEKMAHVVRQPEFLRKTELGSTYLAKELFSIKIENVEYDSLEEKRYYELLSDYVDISYDEFSKNCKGK